MPSRAPEAFCSIPSRKIVSAIAHGQSNFENSLLSPRIPACSNELFRLFRPSFCVHSQFWRAPKRPALPASLFRLAPCNPRSKRPAPSVTTQDRLTEQHLTRQQWSDELEKMEGLGAVIPDADRTALLNYLTRNFGPRKRARRSQQRNPETQPTSC
jgi:hypothetical protein